MNGARTAQRVLVAQPAARPGARRGGSSTDGSLDELPLSVGIVREADDRFTPFLRLMVELTAEAAVVRDLAPRARLVDAGETAELPIELVRHARAVDADKGVVMLSWRAAAPCGPLPVDAGAGAPPFEHLLVSLEVDAAPRPLHQISGARARGRLSFAAEAGVPASPHEADELRMARFVAWETCSTPALPLAEYAAVSAALAEGREPRAEVLARHDLSEDTWTFEERAWLQTIGDRALEGDGRLAVEYGECFTAAQDALAAPGEEATTLDEYVAVRARLHRAHDPTPVLREQGITLPRWLRLDRRFSGRARGDAALAAEIERRTAEELSRLGPLPEDD